MQDFITYFDFITYRVYADLRSEASRFYLSYLWWIIEPVFEMVIYFVVFGLFLRRDQPDFPAFLLCGLVAWKWLGSSLQTGSVSIQHSLNLRRQVHLPPKIFPLIALANTTFKFAIVFTLLIIVLNVMGHSINSAYLSLPLVFAAEISFILFVSYLFAILIPFFPDVSLIMTRLLQFGFFLSGIFYPGSALPSDLQPFFYSNPMAVIIESYRDILLVGKTPDLPKLGLIFLSFSLAFAILWTSLHRLESRYMKVPE